MTDILNAGERLLQGQQLKSGNGRYSLDYQGDGNVVIYHYTTLVQAEPIWATHRPHTPGEVAMQGDGNLVVYASTGHVMFATMTFDAGSHLVMQDDGNLVIYDGDRPVWATRTSRPIEPPLLKPIQEAPIAPREYSGNMCGVRVSGISGVAGGSAADPSLVLSWFYDRYSSGDRERIRAVWASRGYWDVLLSWPDSRAHGASPDDFVATCAELIAAGFRPCVMLLSKDHDPHYNVSGCLDRINQVLGKLLSPRMCSRICIGWELSLWLSPDDVQRLTDAIAPSCVQAGVNTYVHFQQGYSHFAPDSPTTTFATYWNRQIGKLTGLL